MANSSNIKARDIVKGMFSSFTPVTINTVDSARSVASDIRTIGRKINTGMRQNMMQIDKSQPGRKAIALFSAAKEALTDGTYEINQVNEDMYEDYEEYDSNFTLDDMTEDERANTSPEEIILKGNRGIAQSVIRASTAQLEGMDAVSRKILRGVLKTSEASTKSINATIIYSTNILTTQLGTMNNKLDTINENLVNLINYQNENTTRYYEKNLELMDNMLNSMTNLTAMSQGKSARDLKNFDTRNGFNIKEYLNRVKKGIKDSTLVSGVGMIGSTANLAKENPDIMSMGELIGSGIAMLADMIPGISDKTKKLNVIDRRLSQYMNETLYKIGDKLSSNLVASVLGLDSLGNKRRRNYGIDMSNYMKEQLPWNGKAQKALTEVIPELLTSIDAGINNTDKRYFDYDQGYFKSRKEIEKDFSDQVSTSISLEFNDMMDKLGKKFNLSGKSPKEIEAAKEELSNIINKRIYGEGDLTSARQEMANLLQKMNLSTNEFSSAFNNIEEAITNVTEQMAELYSKIGSADSVYRNINNRSGSTADTAIGKEAFKTLRMHRTSGAKDVSLFKSSISTDVKDTIDRITREIKSEIPEFKMTKEYEQYINMAVRRGDSDFEIIRAVKNTFGRQNFFEIAKKKLYKLFGKEYTASIEDENTDDINLGKYGNMADISMLQGVYGIETNYQDINDQYYIVRDKTGKIVRKAKNRANQAVLTHRFKRDFDDQGNMVKKPKPRSKNGVGDTSYTNKAASSQRSRMDGKSAGAEAAHDKKSANDGISFEYPIDQETEDLKDAMTNEASKSYDKMINSDEDSLNNGEKLRDSVSKTISDIGKNGSTSFGGALKNAIDTMVLSMGSMISSFTSFGSRLFGKEGIIKNFFKSDEFKAGMNKIKDFLIGDENGIFKDQWAKLKAFGRNTWEKTKDKLTDAYDWAYRNYSTYKYGEEYEKNEDWQNNELMQKLNLKKRREEKKAMLAAQQDEEKASQSSSLKSSENKIEPETLTTSTGKVIHKNAAGRWVDSNNKFVSNAEITDAKKTSNTAAITETKSTTSEIQNVTEKITSNDKNKEGKSSVQEIQKATDDATEEATKELKSSVQKIADAGEESAKELKESTEKFTTAVVGDPKEKPEDIKKTYSKSFSDKLKGLLPKIGAGAIIGAGVGFLNGVGGHSLLGSLFLPTGLIGGAIVGGGLTILSQTEAFRSLMFGKKDKNGERSGGLISNELKAKFKKAAPIAVGGAITGAITSILKTPLTGGKGLGILGMQLLPGGILGGAIMGMGVGLLKNSEFFQNLVFGKKNEKGERSGTWLSKSFNKMKDKMAGTSTYIKNAIKGGVVGTISGATLANMGALPAALSAGPIGLGIAGLGIGIASSTKKFQDWLFGTEELDENGNSLGRKGGFLGRVKNLINANVVEPISFAFRKNTVELINWTKDKITLPFRTAFGPILDSISGIKDNVVDFVQSKFEDIGNGITSMIQSTLGKLFSPITRLIGKAGSALISGAKVGLQLAASPIAVGLQGLNILTMGKRRKDYKEYRKAYLAQEEAGGMNNRLIEYWNAKEQDGQKVGFFDKISDTINAYMGKGEIAESFRKGYVEEKKAQGQDHFDWLTARDDKKKLRIDRSKDKKAFKKWENINRYGRKLANEFGGREFDLTPAMFEKYKKKFVNKGIDASLINDSADIMDLIYRPSQFKKKAAGDSGRLGELEALKKFRLTDEEKAHMATTEKYQSNVEKYLQEIRDAGKITAEELMFDRSMTTYNEDRKRDTKRLHNKLKKAYKSSLWEGKKAINLNDPELYEYDIEGITDEDLQDYAASNFADNNDFKGYLKSIGRKMSPDDDRVAYHSAIKKNGLWKRSSGKTSEEKPPESKPDTTDSTQAAILNEIKQSRELQEANLEISTGGDVTADDVKKNNYKDFGKRKVAKYSIFGALTNLFNRKSKEDKKNAAAAKEAEEQKEATALGNEPSKENEENSNENAKIVTPEQKGKKQSIFSKIANSIFGGIGVLGTKASSNPILRTIFKFGKIAIPAVLGMSVLDVIRPGTVEQVGASLDEFNKSVDDGSFVENVKTKIMNGIDYIQSSISNFFTETKLGKSMSGVFTTVSNVITDTLPTVIIKTLENLPKMASTVATWIGDNSKLLVNTSVDVVEKIGPPLVDALVDSLPTLAYQLGIKLPIEVGESIFKKLVNSILIAIGMSPIFKDEELEDNSNLTKTEADNSGKNYQVDKNAEKVYLTDEEAAKITKKGGVIRKDSQGVYEEKYVTPTSNIAGFDDNGNAIYVNNNGVIQSAAKLGINAAGAALAGTGKLMKVAGVAKKLAKPVATVGKAVLKTSGAVSKGAGKILTNTVGKIPILGIPSKIVGGVLNAEGSILSGLANPVQTVMGTVENPSLISKAVNGVKSIGSKITNSKIGQMISRKTTTALSNAASESAEVAVKKVATASASVADDAAKIAGESATSLLSKISKAIKGLKTNKTLLSIIDKFKSVIGKEVKPLETICLFLDDLVKAIAFKCKGKLATKITTMLSKGLAKAGATTVPLITVVSGAWGVTTGAMEAENLFGVDEADGFMMIISAIMKGLLSISFGCIFDLLFEIASEFLNRDIKQEIAMKLYKLLTLASPNKYIDLVNSQDNQEIERQIYNNLYGLNLDSDAYNDLDNSKIVDSVLRSGKNLLYTITGNSDKKTISTKNMSKAVEYLHSAGYSDEEISKMSSAQLKSAISTASGGRLSFGSGPNSNAKIVYGEPYAQGNSEWANMPIGKFANGKTSTMGTGGCGPTALSAVANIYGNGVSPADMGKYASENGYITQGGANEKLFTEGAARLGMNSSKIDKKDLKDAISTGNPMIISGKNSGPFTKAGHVVVAHGTDKHGNAIVLDPSDGKVKTYSTKQLESGMNEAWSYGNKSVGYGRRNGGNSSRSSNTTIINNSKRTVKTSSNKTTVASNRNPLALRTVGPTQSALQTAMNANSGMAGPVTKEYIQDVNQKALQSVGIKESEAVNKSKEIADNVMKSTIGKTTTTTSKPSRQHNRTDETTARFNGYTTSDWDATAVDNVNNNDYTDSYSDNNAYDTNTTNYEDSNNVSIADNIAELKTALSGEPENLSGLIGAFKKFGYAMEALVGTLKGEGTFSYLYNELANNTDIDSDTLSGTGKYSVYSDKNKSQQTAIWNYFLNKGYEKNAIAGIMGAWQTESANKALRVEGDYLKKAKDIGIENILATPASLDSYTTNVLFPAYKKDGISVKESAYRFNSHYYPGLGLAQWTGRRAYNLRKYASENNGDWRDLKTQLSFADKEITTKYGNLKDKLNKATSPEEAAKIFVDKYEGNSRKLADQKKAAADWYKEYANSGIVKVDRSKYRRNDTSSDTTNFEMYGKGPSGYGPEDDTGPSNLSELISGASTATDYLQSKIDEMGLGELFNLKGTTSTNTSSISYDENDWMNSPDQYKPVQAMKSIYGKLNYSLAGNRQNPDTGAASCASTVAWAYKKALGIRPGDTVSSSAYASSTAQSKDNRFTTIWTNNGSGLTENFVRKYMQPGDIVYQNWKRSSNNGNMTHTEMYAGNGQTLSHGGPNWGDKGPVFKNLLSSDRKQHTMMIRRYNGFLNNTAYGNGPSDDNRMSLENNFFKEVNEQNEKFNRSRLKPEGDRTTGFGLGGDTSNLEDRLDKIFNIITEWYLMEKKSYSTKGFGSEKKANVTNTTVVNTSTNVVKEKETKANTQFTSNIDKLTQKHSAFARMYKTSI